jgi:hypothetical protein
MDRPCRSYIAFVAVVLVALLPTQMRAQSLTGSLLGTVKDAQGGILQGAVIRVSSPSLMTGEQHTISNERGEWRFPSLPPGRYGLSVELTPKFAPYRKNHLGVGADETLEVAIVLQLAGVAESVTVTGDLAINSRSSGLETRFSSDDIRTIPTRRFSMFDLIRSTPGVSPTSPSSGTVNTVSVFGSAVNENAFLIDGTNFTCPCQGVSRAEPIVDVIQEIDVLSMGASVEYGNIQGGVINVVTKQGGARFSGEASYYGQPAGLTAQPVVISVTRGTQPSSGYERVRYRDLTTSLGGPVRRERVWFFGAYQYLRDYDSQPGADPAFPRRYEQNKIFGKLTSRLTPSLQLMNSFHQENWVNPTPPTLATPFVATQRINASVPSTTFAHLTHVLSSSAVWEARVGRFILHQNNDPSSGDRTTPFHRDQITGFSSGNAPQIGGLLLDRITAKAVLDRYQSAALGDHHLKAGVQVERGEHRLRQLFPGGVQYIDNNSAPFQAIFRAPSTFGGVFITSALFASDSFSINNRTTLDAGLRLDHSRAISQDLPGVDAEGNETGEVTKGLGTIYTWNVLSPRLGFVVKLDGTGRTTARASYGRFNQGVLTGELDPISPAVTTTRTMAYDETTSGYTRLVSEIDPRVNLAVDPHTRTPHTDEFSFALDRSVARGLRASAAYVRKRGRDFIGWTDTGGQYRQMTRTLADGTIVPVFELTNGTSARRFLLTNPQSLFLHYDAFVAAVERQRSNGWQASASYTYSRAFGLQVMSNATADAPQFSTIARPGFLTFGQDPNDFTNATGRLPNDRPHVFRATGAAQLPWHQILIAANLQYFSGKPWAATAQVPLPQGSQRILLEPRGSRRLSSQPVLDLRASKTFRISNTGNVDLILDVLNLLNDTPEEAVASDNLFSATFGRPTQFIDPRRAMLGVRLNLGG